MDSATQFGLLQNFFSAGKALWQSHPSLPRGFGLRSAGFFNGEKLGTHRSQFTPVRFKVADKLVYHVSTLTLADNNLRLSARVGSSGHVYHDETATARLLPDSATKLTDIVYLLAEVEAVFFSGLALSDTRGVTLAANRHPFSRTENLAEWRILPQTKLELTHTETGLVVANSGAQTALFVWVEDARPLEAAGDVYIGDNHFCLLLGKTRRLTVTWTGVSDQERHLKVIAWNTESTDVRGSA